MKKLSFLLALFSSISIWSQSNGINFQSIILDSNGQIESNTSVQLEFSIDNPNGNTVYSESQTLTTDNKGIVNTVIGVGTPTVGTSLSDLDWKQAYSLEVFRLINGGYVSQGTSTFQSVPYSFVSQSVASDGIEIQSGLVSATLASFSGVVTASSFVGDGSLLTNISIGNLNIGDLGNAQYVVGQDAEGEGAEQHHEQEWGVETERSVSAGQVQRLEACSSAVYDEHLASCFGRVHFHHHGRAGL